MADLTSAQRNAINLTMRQAPWYQEWFRARGLNPNKVKLSDMDRKALAQAATQHGMPIPDHTLIDQAGNVNIQHGFAGLPTWAKVAIVSGAALTGAGAFGVGPLGGVLGIGGGSSAPAAGVGATGLGGAGGGTTVGSALSLPTMTSLTGAPIVSVGAGAPAAASVVAPTVAGGSTVGSLLNFGSKVAAPNAGGGMGFSLSDIVKAAIPSAISATTGILTARSQGQQADRAMQAELEATKYATDAQTKSAAEQLAFAREQEAARLAEARRVEALNLDQYNQSQARLAPYRNLGSSAVSLFGKPITVGSALGV